MLKGMDLRYILIGLLTCTATGCAVEVLAHGLDEREANKIIELLADNDISASKMVVEGREISFNLTVPAKQRVDAVRLLNYYEMPRRRDKGYNEIFKESGLIPTSAEEKAKKLSALEGEIERELKIIDGIIDVQVQLVQPDDMALKTTQDQQSPTTASITIKYLPVTGGAKPLSEPQVQAIVAGGVENLTPENVVVVMTPASKTFQPRPGSEVVVPAPSRWQTLVLIGALMGIVLLGIGLAFSQMRLNSIRGRLVRLQDQIQKARTKKGDEAPAA